MRRWILLAAMLCAAPVHAQKPSSTGADAAYLRSLYEHLHRNPELSNQEVKTAERMAQEFRKAGLEVTTKVGGTGVVGVVRNGEGPVLLLRADMDGLPVTEETGLPYASKVVTKTAQGVDTGVMHACGHDVHMTVLVGTLRRLMAMRDKWAGTLVAIAQPAEELGTGARAMLADGLFTRFPKPAYALAIHDAAALPAGKVAFTSGYALASVDSVDLTVRGVGGHGAYPHTTRDPIVIAARTVTALQTLVSRDKDPLAPAVVTVGSIHGGTKHNIIPDEVKLQLTVRSYTEAVRQQLHDGIKRIAEAEAMAAGVPADRMPVVKISRDINATFNTEKLSRLVAGRLADALGKDNVMEVAPVMGGEDFSEFYLADKNLESMIFWVGALDPAKHAAAGGDPQKLPSLHSSKFAPLPDPTLATGVEALTTAAMAVVGRGQQARRLEGGARRAR